MKNTIIFLVMFAVLTVAARAQTNTFPTNGAAGIGTTSPNASTLLDVTSTTKGVLLPRMTKTQRDAIALPVQGLLIYQTNNTPGLYYYDGGWSAVAPKNANKSLSNLTTPTAINVDLLPGTDNTINLGSTSLRWKDLNLYNLKFADGTTQSTAFAPYISGTGINISGNTITNTAPDQPVSLAAGSGISITGAYPSFSISSTGGGNSQWTTNGTSIYYNTGNVGIGTSTPSSKLQVTGDANINGLTVGLGSGTGYNNTVLGAYALYANTSGASNTVVGGAAMTSNTTGSYNSCLGRESLYYNTTGSHNSCLGWESLYYNTTGSYNIAIGENSLFTNTTGQFNTGLGFAALANNQTGNYNVAVGARALPYCHSGNNNTAVGYVANYSSNSASNNTAVGDSSLFTSVSGSNNTSTGYNTLHYDGSGYENTANGVYSLYTNTTGYQNTAIGSYSLYSNSIGTANTACGTGALYTNGSGGRNVATGYNALYSNLYGGSNTAAGYQALYSNYNGDENAAFGYLSLYSNTTGDDNTALGYYSLYSNTTGSYNLGDGRLSLYNNTIGTYNTAVGPSALSQNTSGSSNVAVGSSALSGNTTASNNSALGSSALSGNTTGAYNNACGTSALSHNNTGNYSSASGYQALYNNTASYNKADGANALYSNTTGYGNTADGYYALYTNTTGHGNTGLGDSANVSTSNLVNATAIGWKASVDASNKVRIGNSSVTSNGGQVSWSTYSDVRIKKSVKENVPGLEFINALRPVTFHYDVKKENDLLGVADDHNWEGKYDVEKMQFTGFIAQEVESAAKKFDYDFSGVDKSGNVMSLRYSEFVVPLVKAVQELSAKSDAKDETISNQQKEIDELKSKVDLLLSSIENQESGMNNGFVKLQASDTGFPAILGQNIPNPFDNSTLIPFRIPKDCNDASIMITNTSTTEVIRVIPISCSEDHVSIYADTLASGTYSYSLYVDGTLIQTKQMAIVR